MRIRSALFFVLLGIVAPYGAGAQRKPLPSHSAGSALEGENLLFAPPKNYKQAHHDDRVGSLTEFVPVGETVESWTELITVQVFRGLKADPEPFLQTIGKHYTQTCPGLTSPNGVITGQDNGYVVSMLVIKCPLNLSSGKPETTVFRIIKGKDALYSVQHAWRSAVSNKDLGAAVLGMRKVTVCDTRDTNHPCPSFDELAP